MARRKITVIGVGAVGSTTAYTLALRNVANEIVLLDIRESKAMGEAMDIYQGTPLLSEPVNIYAGNYEDAAGSDIVVITSGMPRKPGQTRIDLAQTNVDVIKEIATQIVKYCPDATYIIVSNPVDILTYIFLKVTGLPANQVLGSGTVLDTARLRARISQYLSISQKNIHAYVLGEHGETSFVPWSIATVSAIDLLNGASKIHTDSGVKIELDCENIETYLRSSGAKIIERKGCTNYAIAISVSAICDVLYGNASAVSTVSTLLSGEYGISDVCLSLPSLLCNGRVQGNITPDLTDDELAKLHRSADALKHVIANIKM